MIFSNGLIAQVVDLEGAPLHLVNRQIVNSDDLDVVHLNAQEDAGMAVLEEVTFDSGTIELELLGENTPGRSFVGLAFNVQNDSTYEAIYFRPFNFRAGQEVSRERSVQYINHPEYSWRKLRTDHPGVYEAAFPNPPEPNDWFTIRITIQEDKVVVLDVENGDMLLTVERLTNNLSEKVAFWTGHNSRGGFRNLRIKDD